MSIRRFLAPATSADQLQVQLRDQELAFGMQISGIGICQTADNPPLKNNFVELTSHIREKISELQVAIVAKEVANDEAKFSTFLNLLGAEASIVDIAIVLIDGVEQEIVLFRSAVAGGSLVVAQSPSALTPTLPDYAQDILSAVSGVPWAKSESVRGTDDYIGILPQRSRSFRNLTDPGGRRMDVVYYECKFDIDNDGSGGNAENDPFHQSDTSLHDIEGKALDANQIPFAVLPLDRSQSKGKRPGLTDFGKDLGLGIGDVGIAFWRPKNRGPVRSSCFVYGDAGPPNKLGEGSVQLAKALGVNPNPVSGGIDSNTIKRLGKGIVHIGFPGSGKDFLTKGRVLRTSLVPDRIEARAKQLFASFLRQPS
jgi:hypothetical protein